MTIPCLTIVCLVLHSATGSSVEGPDAVKSCDATEALSAPGAQLMQRTTVNEKLGQPKVSLMEADTETSVLIESDTDTSVCSVEKAHQALLTNDGFQDVAATCCFDDMKEYILRTAADLGLQACNEGGLSGMAPFFSCPEKMMTLDDLKTALQAETADSGNACPWLAAVGEECPTVDATKCGVVTNPTAQPSLVKGYVGLQAESNPAALVTTPGVKESIRSALAEDINVPEDAVVVTVGTGPLDGVSLLSLGDTDGAICTVFASYAVVQTDPPTLEESTVIASVSAMDATKLEKDIAAKITKNVPAVGALKMTKFRSCKKGGKCEEKKMREDTKSVNATTSLQPGEHDYDRDQSKPKPGQNPFEACSSSTGHLHSSDCAVDMGEGVAVKEGSCVLTGYKRHSSLSCDIGQMASCEDKASEDTCVFEGIEGACSTVNPTQGHAVDNYCNIWPTVVLITTTTPVAITTSTAPESAPSLDMQACRDEWKSRGAACTISMGDGEPPLEGSCKLGNQGPCDVGQMVAMEASGKSAGDTCTFAGREGKLEFHNNLYCNIWPTPYRFSAPISTTTPEPAPIWLEKASPSKGAHESSPAKTGGVRDGADYWLRAIGMRAT